MSTLMLGTMRYPLGLRVLGIAASAVLLISCGEGDTGVEAQESLPQLSSAQNVAPAQITLGYRSGTLLQLDGLQFRDLNRNGKVDGYEDWRNSAQSRAQDLVSRMTLEEKAGAMLHASLAGRGDSYDLEAVRAAIVDRHINSMITRLSGTPEQMAEQNNAIQLLAEESRLGIPLTISTDPRHHFQFTEGASVAASGYSQWPELLGFAALDDVDLIKQFADIARQEYRAVGIHMGLSPQADLGTEPRWSRFNGTFGEDAHLAKRMVQAYIEGFQHGNAGLSSDSVALVVKHWVGYGAAMHGFDSHNYYGRYAVFDGNNFDYHLIPFEGAFAANVSGVMPTYSILKDLEIEGEKLEQVGAGFNRFLLTDLLRGQYGFKGIILSDWAITVDCPQVCLNGEHDGEVQSFATLSTAWGAIDLSVVERFAKGINAGIDQFGGTEAMAQLAATVTQGLVSEMRLDESVTRLLQQKFELGLFENPYVDVAYAQSFVGNSASQQVAENAQRSTLILLENKNNILPLNLTGKKVYLYGIDEQVAAGYGLEPVATVEEAELAIIRATTPFEILHPNYVFGRMQHEGDLSFHDGNVEYEAIKAASALVPTIVTVYLDRPAVLTNISTKVSALLGNFGIDDQALLEVISGKNEPKGKLPFQLPATMEAVEKQFSDVPGDADEQLYPFGFGLQYQ